MFLSNKAPFRPKADVSQSYNDGIVTIYTVQDGGDSGYMPAPSLTKAVSLCYQERKLGVQRYYEAKQNQINIKRVIRVQDPKMQINSQDVAETEDGVYYRIDLVQFVPDAWPRSYDLTLVLYDQGVPESGDDPAAPEDPVTPDTQENIEEPGERDEEVVNDAG